MQPTPFAANDEQFAAFFLSSQRIITEGVGNFRSLGGYEGGDLIRKLVRHGRWRYRRLPLDGLRSIVFHGPSPTLCIAAGDVWYDHPHSNMVGCIPRASIPRLERQDRESGRNRYDWHLFYSPDLHGQVCLRNKRDALPVQ
jgi:hypothetical protein